VKSRFQTNWDGFIINNLDCKFVVFGGACAIVGSSNLTDPALHTNQEANVVIGADDQRYEGLLSLFVSWWDQAKVLDTYFLAEYSKIYDRHRKTWDPADLIEEELQKKQGRVTIKNIERDKEKPGHILRFHEVVFQ